MNTDLKQWEQLEDHRKRLDGLDIVANSYDQKINVLDVTDQKQWEQLEDHRKRLDGLDLIVNKVCVTDQKQWEQLEDHRKRLDGLDSHQNEEKILIQQLMLRQ